MTGTILSPSSRKMLGRLVLWGLAAWLVLQLHDAPIAGGHTICGPWGCGPTIPALLAAHGFWLVTLLPLAYHARSWLPTSRTIPLGRMMVCLCVAGIAALLIRELTQWPATNRAELRAYLVQHCFFALATLVEVPLIPGLLAGLIMANTARRGIPGGAEGGRDEGPRDSQGSAVDPGPAPDRIEVGRRFPRLSLPTNQDRIAIIPDEKLERISILYFMRHAGCSTCRAHVRRLAESQKLVDALGADIFIIHPGDSRASRSLSDSLDLRFPIIASRDRDILGDLGWKSGRLKGLANCGTLLIDGRGTVRSVRLSHLPFRGFHETELLAALRRINDEIPSGLGQST